MFNCLFMKNSLLFRLVVLVAALVCAFGASAQEAYAVYTSDNTTLTFYFDYERSSRTGTTYYLNNGAFDPGWVTDRTNDNVKQVVIDPSFADFRPMSTYHWCYEMRNLESIIGIYNLNTSEVMRMDGMFMRCYKLTVLNLGNFNTSKVTDMSEMFRSCSALQTIYVGDGWSMSDMTLNFSRNVFKDCTSLVGDQGTTYDADHVDADYAHIDGGSSNPGYLSNVIPEAYAVYYWNNTTLTFYYDNYRNSRPDATYDLNTGETDPGWDTDYTKYYVTRVVFDPLFAGARPTTTYSWFYEMMNLESITGIEYLNTSEVTNMAYMFCNCEKLASFDVSHFNTSKVTSMAGMFHNCRGLTSLDMSSFNTSQVTDISNMFVACSKLQTVYVGSGWSTDAVNESRDMFFNCRKLVGGQGTTYNDFNPSDKTYAHIDGGTDDPGYFTDKNASIFIRGDVNGDHNVNISDVTALINYLLSLNATGVNVNAADCNQDGAINISDVTTLINYLLSGAWPQVGPQLVTETFTVNGVTFTMVMVEGGTFTMGGTPEQGEESDPDEQPTHQVTLSNYWIGQTEVTQALWQAVMGENPSDFPGDLERPVEMVSWPECQTFINNLNQITGRNFKFPTEAQWEFAARGGNLSQGYKYAGSNTLDDVAWYYYDGCTDLTTHPVATKQPNELGLYDMSGNVKEWCFDEYAPYSSEPQTDPTGPSGNANHVYRGGGWASIANDCRVTYRYSNRYWANSLGLRLAL